MVAEVFVGYVLNLIVLICYYNIGSLMYLEPLLCFKYQTQLDLQHGGIYFVNMNTEFSDVTAAYC